MIEIPTINVAKYVQELATLHGITYQRTHLEDWAEAVSSHSGDDVTTDYTNGLLIRLYQQKVITNIEFIRLNVNHYRESKHD